MEFEVSDRVQITTGKHRGQLARITQVEGVYGQITHLVNLTLEEPPDVEESRTSDVYLVLPRQNLKLISRDELRFVKRQFSKPDK